MQLLGLFEGVLQPTGLVGGQLPHSVPGAGQLAQLRSDLGGVLLVGRLQQLLSCTLQVLNLLRLIRCYKRYEI